MRQNPVISFLLLLFFACTKPMVMEVCDQDLPGYLIVDEKKHDACEIISTMDSIVETNLGWKTDPDGITFDVNDDGWNDFKIFPSGYHALSGNAYGMTIESLNDYSYFATTDVQAFNLCILYRPYGGIYVDCREYCNEFSEEELVPNVDTLPSIKFAKYVEAFSPGDLIDNSLNWESVKTHFFKSYSAHWADKKCWPESKWFLTSWQNTDAFFVPIKQKKSNGATAFGWLKLQYGGDYYDSYIGGAVPHAFIHESYIQSL